MKLAICDDDERDLRRLADYCRDYDAALDVREFHAGQELLQGFQQTFYDIVFLDIEMEAPNGYEVATRLMAQEQKPLIIFTTQNLNYAVRGYGIAFRYLPKPISYRQLLSVLPLALETVLPQRIAVPFQGDTKILDLSQIIYLEVFRHQVQIYLKDSGVLETRTALSELMKQMNQTKIVQIHKSFCVNLDYVDRVSLQEVVLTNGAKLPLSRYRRDSFNRQLSAYLKGSQRNELWY